MDLAKPFDPQALISALKTKGLQDAEKIVTADIMPVVFDWLNSSVELESRRVPLLKVAEPVLIILEERVLDAVIAEFGLKPA